MLITVLVIAATVFTVFWLIPKIKRNVAAAKLAEKEEAARRARQQEAERVATMAVRRRNSSTQQGAERGPRRPARHPAPASAPDQSSATDVIPETFNSVWYTPASVLNAMTDPCTPDRSSSPDSSSSSDSGCSSDSGSSSSDSN